MDWLCGVETTTWWSVTWATLVKKAQQRIYFLRTLSKALLSASLMKSFYHCKVESILTYCITVLYGKCLQHIQRQYAPLPDPETETEISHL